MVRKAEDFSVRKDYRRRSYAGIVTDEMILSGEKDSPKITKLFFEDYLKHTYNGIIPCDIKAMKMIRMYVA